MDYKNDNGVQNNSKHPVKKILFFIMGNKKEIIQLVIISAILFFIYIFVFYREEIIQGFTEGWRNIE